MAAAAARKLAKEIDTTLKKVEDGIFEFEEVFERAYQERSEKLGEDLKKEIGKLQRYRVQIREWISQSEVKQKDKLDAARKKIEFNMQRFKEFERELKTKAYSTNALAKDEDELEDPEKRSAHEWITRMLSSLQEQQETLEADIEVLQLESSSAAPSNNSKQKKKAKDGQRGKEESLQEIEEKNAQKAISEWHVKKLELLLRSLNNDTLQISLLEDIKESVEYYLEAGLGENYFHDDTLYESFDAVVQEFAVEQDNAASKAVLGKIANSYEENEAELEKLLMKKAKKVTQKKAIINPAAQKNVNAIVKKEESFEVKEHKISEDQLVQDSDEFICKICYVHVVGCSPKLTKCSHLFWYKSVWGKSESVQFAQLVIRWYDRTKVLYVIQ